MANADKRSVSTDALETLGTAPIGPNEARDAIHLAVEPSIAAEKLFAGQHVGLIQSAGGLVASAKAEKLLGIVDPFLDDPVYPGDRFWLVVYPRQIKSLRHVWEHPDFPVSGETAVVSTPVATGETVASVAQRIETKPGNVIKFLFKSGIMATVNQRIDYTTVGLIEAHFAELKARDAAISEDIETSRRWIEDCASRYDLSYEELLDGARSYLKWGEYIVDGGRYEGMYLDQDFWNHYENVTGETVPEQDRGSFFSCSC